VRALRRWRARTRWGLGVLTLFVLLIVGGTVLRDPDGKTSSERVAPVPTRSARPSSRDALVALETLPVKGRAPKTGYDRDQFGDGWATVAGCDMRDRILARDLTRKAYASGDTCAVQSGQLNDP
jgi:hypothetical protein